MRATTTPLERRAIAAPVAAATLLAAALGAAACTSDGTLKAKQESEFFILTPTYVVEKNLGKGPVPIESAANLVRFEVRPRAGSAQYALVLFPDKVDGAIELDLGTEAAAAGEASAVEAAASDLGPYYDQVLRAHRLLLRADVEGARRLLDRIDAAYDSGYATLVLRGDVALLDGDPRQAERYFSDAKARAPQRADIGQTWLPPGGEKP